jgi:hypothetical protein
MIVYKGLRHSVMWYRLVWQIRNNVSKEPAASLFRVEDRNLRNICVYRAAWRDIPFDRSLLCVSLFEGEAGCWKAEYPTTLRSEKNKKETRSDAIVGLTRCISRFSTFFWEPVIVIKGPMSRISPPRKFQSFSFCRTSCSYFFSASKRCSRLVSEGEDSESRCPGLGTVVPVWRWLQGEDKGFAIVGDVNRVYFARRIFEFHIDWGTERRTRKMQVIVWLKPVRARRSGIWIPVGTEIFQFSKTFRTVSGANPASWSVVHAVIWSGLSGRRVTLTVHLHLVPRLRMSGATSPLPLYSIMGWTGPLLAFTFFLVCGYLL